MVAEDMTEIYGVPVPESEEVLKRTTEDMTENLDRTAFKGKLPTEPYMGEGSSAKMHDHPLSTEEIIEQIQKGVEPKSLVASDFSRKAEFAKFAFWLRSYGHDEDMARFIEAIALKKNFARDYRVQMHLLKMFTKVFRAAENLSKPYVQDNTTIKQYTDRWKALKKEVDIIRTEINRLLHTTYRGIKRKYPHGGTRDDSRGSPDPG